MGETSIMCRISIRINFFKKLQLYILYVLLCTKYTVNSGGSTSQANIREFCCCKISIGLILDIKLFTKCCLRSLSAVLCCGLDISCTGYWHHSILKKINSQHNGRCAKKNNFTLLKLQITVINWWILFFKGRQSLY